MNAARTLPAFINAMVLLPFAAVSVTVSTAVAVLLSLTTVTFTTGVLLASIFTFQLISRSSWDTPLPNANACITRMPLGKQV